MPEQRATGPSSDAPIGSKIRRSRLRVRQRRHPRSHARSSEVPFGAAEFPAHVRRDHGPSGHWGSERTPGGKVLGYARLLTHLTVGARILPSQGLRRAERARDTEVHPIPKANTQAKRERESRGTPTRMIAAERCPAVGLRANHLHRSGLPLLHREGSIRIAYDGLYSRLPGRSVRRLSCGPPLRDHVLTIGDAVMSSRDPNPYAPPRQDDSRVPQPWPLPQPTAS